MKLDFVGANAPPIGVDRTRAVVSYFKGARDRWRAGLPAYARVVYRDLWPGIDLAFYGQAGRLKYDFQVHPGADPGQIRLRYRGAESVGLNVAGQLEVITPLGGFTEDAPIAWQEIAGRRVPVPVAFELGATHAARPTQHTTSYQPSAITHQLSAISHSQSFTFSLGAYDRSQPLVIDPTVLAYCGYIGGGHSDNGWGIAVDGDGNAYVAGETLSAQATFPETVGPYLESGGSSDAFVAKVNPSGAELVYAGFIGGSGWDGARAIAVDGNGNAYIAGHAGSDQISFPVRRALDPTFNGVDDAFVAKVGASGADLVYCGYIGGSAWDEAFGIAVDGEGSAYVTGETNSTEATFPDKGGLDPTFNGGYRDAFVAKVNPSGDELVYAGYIGGSGGDYGHAIAVDGTGNAYVTGYTNSDQDTFPETVGPGLTRNGNDDAFVAKVDAAGEELTYAGYIGGSAADIGWGIAVDDAGSAHVTGETGSTQSTFPVKGQLDPTYNGGERDAFVAMVNPSGAALDLAGYIGGSSTDYGTDIALDGAGNATIVGHTGSTQATFPVTRGPDLSYSGGTFDVFVARVNRSWRMLDYAGYIGGSGIDAGWGIAVDDANDAYVTGYTTSTEATFPVKGELDPTYNGDGCDAYVAKVSFWWDGYLPLVVRIE